MDEFVYANQYYSLKDFFTNNYSQYENFDDNYNSNNIHSQKYHQRRQLENNAKGLPHSHRQKRLKHHDRNYFVDLTKYNASSCLFQDIWNVYRWWAI